MGELKRKKLPSFEIAMQKLEAIVQKLEAGEIPLEQLVQTYQDGLTYEKICRSHLDRAAFLLEELHPDGHIEKLSKEEENTR